MFGFLGGGRGGAGGAGGGGGRGNRKRWWSLGGGGGVGGLLDDEAEDAAVVVAAAAAPRQQEEQQEEEGASSSASRRRRSGGKELTDIERLRQENLKQNQAFLQSLGIGQAKAALAQEAAGAGPSGQNGGGGQQQGRKRKRGRSGVASGGGHSSVPTLEQVSRKWVGREEQIRALARLLPVSPAAAAVSGGALHVEEGAASPVLLVHGPSGAGKTGVLRDLLPALRLPHAYVRGPEHPTARSFYGAVAAAWMRFIEAQAKALGMEGLGYVAGTDDVDMDYAEEEARALKEARREERRRRRQEERRQRRRAAREGEGSGTEDEGTGDELSSEGGGGESEEEDSDDEEEDDQDGYWNQTAPLAGSGSRAGGGAGGASLVPLNRVATASGLLHLLRSWRGFQQPPPSSTSTQPLPPQHMTPFVIVLDAADRLPRGAAQVRHEIVELPSMLAGARGRGGGFTMGGGGGTSPLVALTVVLVSETPQAAPAALAAGYGLPVPFPAYSKDEATAILLRSLRVAAGLPSSTSSSTTLSSGSAFGTLASSFAALLVGSLYASTRDVREMRRMAALLSQAYLGPLLQPQLQPQAQDKENNSDQQQQQLLSSPTALLEHIRPLLARATQHCLHMPAEPLEQPHAQPPPNKGVVKKEGATASMAQAPTATRFEALLRYELPALARFLVVAAYLASHVAPDTDLFLFAAGSAKSGAGKKRSAKQAVRQERQAEEREAEAEKLGARSFSLERLLSIFTCLLASSRSQGAAYANSTGTTELFAQINALVHHRLLTRVQSRGGGGSKGAGPPPELTAAKFKCNVGYELVLETARELEVKLDMYLDAGRVHAGTSGGSGGGK